MLVLSLRIVAQDYNMDKLKVVATVWGESYLFHPSVIRSDKNVQWEKVLVDFLPHIAGNLDDEEFIRNVNLHMLSHLDDPFTLIQKNNRGFVCGK